MSKAKTRPSMEFVPDEFSVYDPDGEKVGSIGVDDSSEGPIFHAQGSLSAEELRAVADKMDKIKDL